MSDLPTVPPRAKGNRVAVLCGIGRYPNPKVFPLLARVADEIEELRDLLTTGLHPDFQFQLHSDTVYRDDRLTNEKLLKLLIDLRQCRNTEIVFFYLAGHGHRYEGDTYFLTYDASPPFLTNPGVRLGELRHYLNTLGASATIAVLDFCHAGAIPDEDLDRLSLFASSHGDQFADAGGTSSSLTERLIEAIRGASPDNDGYIRWDRIVDRACWAHRKSLLAKPKYAAGTLGDCEFDWRPTNAGQADPIGCILHVAPVQGPQSWTLLAEVRFTITNTTPRKIHLSSVRLVVLDATPLDQSRGITTAAPVDETFLFARISQHTTNVDILCRPHVIDSSRTDGFFLKIDAEDGFSYRLRIEAEWQFLGDGSHSSHSREFAIDVPAHSVEGLLRVAARSSAPGG